MGYRGRSYHAWLLGSAAAIAISSAASAADNAQFDIAPQPLASALNEFSLQSHQSVLFTTDLAAAKSSQGVSGQVQVADALSSLLAGTGLAWKKQGDTFLIVSASDPQSGSAAGDGADAGTVQALIVTAQKREEDIQDVPIAISAFTQEDLTRSQVAGGPDLMTQVPNFTFTKTNFSGYSIQIRGIGTQAISATTDPAVAVAFNNTSFIRNRFFEQEFYDLQRVEVLRGPQGTLYGRNATAGVVNILSATPSNHFEAKLSGDVSNYKSSRFEGMVNIPLVEDKAALRIAGAWTKRDGYVKNILAGEQTDGRDLWSSRVTLGLNPTDNLSVNLIWEHFEENDDRLRSGKQLCRSDPGPSEVNGIPVGQSAASIGGTPTTGYVSQGCLPASLYSPDSFDTPNGYALAYYGALGAIGLPVYISENPYVSTFQSRNLREIETHLKPEYDANSDILELQWKLDLPHNLTLASETGFDRDFIFSFEDYNRFDTTPGVFVPGVPPLVFSHDDYTGPGPYLNIVDENGTFCDPQLGCTNRLAAGDLSTARSRQFSQEFRLSSDFGGPFNFNLGANFLRYDTEEKYYVFINSLTLWGAIQETGGVYVPPWVPGVSDNSECLAKDFYGRKIADPTTYYSVFGCIYVDPNDIHHLNDQGRNYFLSKNPYHLSSYAAFGEAYYNITDNLKLTVGLRWTVDKKTAPVIPSWLLAGPYGPDRNAGSSYGTPTLKVIEQEWRKPTGRVALDWKPDLSLTDETLIYGSYVHGYKAGGANPPPPVLVLATVCPPDCYETNGQLVQHYLTHPETFQPEYVDAYELGTKNTLFDSRLTANLSAFYYDYTGYQISQIVDRSAINFNFDAKVWGAELELDWRPLENLRLGFKGGYENTRVADGMKAIDTMDRTAGKPGWMLFRPFPTLPSNCVIPIAFAAIDSPGNTGAPGENGVVPYPTSICAAYLVGVDPLTYLPYVPDPVVTSGPPIPEGYPGYDPHSANDGQGFEKDLSGHQLPNAPKFTATITADYTVPLPSDWLMTLHTDLYRQSEAWTRIFNDPGYDKLKAYMNVNVAAIFSNEDAGWQVMAYVKNVLDKDNITGAFLNSDDTGLTTNVFLNEPRLYGVRVTKNFSGGAGWIARPHTPGQPYPFTIELGGQMLRTSAPGEGIMPFADAFSPGLNPRQTERDHLDWTHSPEVRFTYQPSGSTWRLAAGVRYGRTINETGLHRFEEAAGPDICSYLTTGAFGWLGKAVCTHDYISPYTGTNKYDPNELAHPKNRLGGWADRSESHTIADFEVGKDVGLGMLGVQSWLSAGLRFAQFDSRVSGEMDGVTDFYVPEGWRQNGQLDATLNHYAAAIEAERTFKGMGPTLSWEGQRQLLGADDRGHLNADMSLTGGVLFGKQKLSAAGEAGGVYVAGSYWASYNNGPLGYRFYQWKDLPTQKEPFEVRRSKSVAVPLVDLSLGLSYEIPGVKIGAGYRWERYFDVLDMGSLTERKSYDRTIDGPYFKIAVGFGG